MSQEEIFDIVDECDRVIGQSPRKEVHRLGLRHRAVHILVFNDRGEVFLQKRSRKKDLFPGCWDSSAAGHLDTGEGYLNAAIRELREEIGLNTTTPLEELLYLEAVPQTGMEFVRVYKTIGNGPFKYAEDEVVAGGWFTCADVTRWIGTFPEEFADGFKYLWERTPYSLC